MLRISRSLTLLALVVGTLLPVSSALAQSACDPSDADCGAVPPRVYLGSVQEREKVTVEVASDMSQVTRISGTVWCSDGTGSESQKIAFAPSIGAPIAAGRVSFADVTEIVGDVTFTYSLDAAFAQGQLRGSLKVAAGDCTSGDQAFTALRQ